MEYNILGYYSKIKKKGLKRDYEVCVKVSRYLPAPFSLTFTTAAKFRGWHGSDLTDTAISSCLQHPISVVSLIGMQNQNITLVEFLHFHANLFSSFTFTVFLGTSLTFALPPTLSKALMSVQYTL